VFTCALGRGARKSGLLFCAGEPDSFLVFVMFAVDRAIHLGAISLALPLGADHGASR
jgi:hypothetical protein